MCLMHNIFKKCLDQSIHPKVCASNVAENEMVLIKRQSWKPG